MTLRFTRQECTLLYISCGDSERDCNLVRQLLPVLERSGLECFFRIREGDFQLRIETARDMIPKCGLLLALVSRDSVHEASQYCQYEIALAMDFRRHILLVTLDDVKIPPLFRKLDRFQGNMNRPFDNWTRKLLKSVQQKLHGQQRPCFEINMVKEYLWNIESREFYELMGSYSKTINMYMSENARLKKRNNELMQIRLNECGDQEEANQRLEAQIQEMREKLTNENGCPYSYVAEISAQCIIYKREKEQLTAEVNALRRSVEKMNDQECKDNGGTADTKMEILYKMLTLEDSALVRPKLEGRSSVSGLRRVPSEVAAFFHRYQGLIGYDEIPALGRELGLTCSQLDDVDRFRSSGPSEMFWQMCRHYCRRQSETCSVSRMVEALTRVGINIESRPMNTVQKQLLEEKLDYFYENMKDVVILLPLLLEKETITPAQAMYIEKAKSCRQRIERLIEVLVTRQNGYSSFCEALELSGQTTLAKFVRDLNGEFPLPSPSKAPDEHEEDAVSSGTVENTNPKAIV